MLKVLLLGSLLFTGGLMAAENQQPTIKLLDWMIGKWDYVDRSLTSNYTDMGTRVCQYTLMNQYILCEMKGVNSSGKKRNSHFYINYNNRNERYEMIALLMILVVKTCFRCM